MADGNDRVGAEAMRAAKAIAARRLSQHAERVRQDMADILAAVLLGNDCPADTIFLAHLMTADDGDYPVLLEEFWPVRRLDGRRTSLGFRVPVGREVARFVIECRDGDFARQLAILVDAANSSERTPERLATERYFLALDYRVMSFTEAEILADPAACQERVELVLRHIAHDVQQDTLKQA